jgi:HEAT repeat protein
MLEATRGAILARGDNGLPLLTECLLAPEKDLFQIALSTARELKGEFIGTNLTLQLGRIPPERAALVILAIADRSSEPLVLPSMLKVAAEGPKPARHAAIGALGRIGDATSVSPLLEIAAGPEADLARAAREALAKLPGEAVDKEILSRLAQVQGKTYPVLIEIVGQRRIDDAVAALLKAVNDSDRAIRSAALASLGNTITPKDLPALVAQAVAPTHADSAAAAQEALKTAAIRMPDRELTAGQLATALERAPAPAKPTLLETLGAVGGTKALQTLHTAAKSGDPQLQEVSSRLLGEWMTIDAAPVLLDLAKTGKPGDKFQVRALRGYIRIARQFTMTEPERAEMCRSALAVARQPAEQKLILEVLTRYPSVDTLKVAVEATKTPELKAEALNATQAIAQKLGKTDEVREILSKAGVER